MRIISIFVLAFLFTDAAVPQGTVQDADSAVKIAEKALGDLTEHCVGGVAVARISQANGRVLSTSYTK